MLKTFKRVGEISKFNFMAMFDVIVTCNVHKNGGYRTEKFETKVDNDVILKAQGSNSKKELDPWAKTFFPASDKVEVMSVRKK
ncbi:MAG: hypothetical protein A2309_14230 [Bacteroidetes bacterium RIFOXYB2_FULL_35_7]|nr:MAG: hypothetical protein A2X01_18785 [Bacteroidetes bacterium GWF2_35_48]OFY93273.1 MAG: hypothetical protein A2309_14230 [Bacteroidetes bacterium RIFOXYB2_FULL_35_7]